MIPGYKSNIKESRGIFRGRANTFRTPGRGATTFIQPIFYFENTSANRIIHIEGLHTDLLATVAKAVTVHPVHIYVTYWHTSGTAVSGGTSLSIVSKDPNISTATSGVVITGDASADGTLSGTALTGPTGEAILSQEYAPRNLTAIGYEMFDRNDFILNRDIILRQDQGLAVILRTAPGTASTQNPNTNHWITTIDWWEEAV